MNMFKTTDATTPEEYISAIEDEGRRQQIRRLHELILNTLPQYKPHIKSGMLAYGHYRYKYASGREGDWMPIALASQKHYISLYVVCIPKDGTQYLAETYKDELPKANIGKSCIRFKKLEDVDMAVLRDVLQKAGEIGPPTAG